MLVSILNLHFQHPLHQICLKNDYIYITFIKYTRPNVKPSLGICEGFIN